MQTTHLLRSVSLTLVLFICALNANSQEGTGALKGLVMDSMGAVVPNAKLVFESRTDGRKVSVTSNGEGAFEVTGVLPGTYKIDFYLMGLAYGNDSVIVRPNRTTQLAVKVSYEGNCPLGPNAESLRVSDSDRSEIISSILDDALGKNFISDGHGLLKKQKDPIILSLETIKAQWIKKPVGVDLQLMSKQQIDEKANRKGDFLHLSFSDWHVGAGCVVVTLNNSWAVADDSPWGYLSGGGRTYVYKKDGAGKWVGEYIGGWIS